MKFGPIIGVCWIGAVIASFIAVAIAMRRHGVRRGNLSLVCPIGALASAGLLVAWVDVVESVYRSTSRSGMITLAIAMLIGLLGIVLQYIGWRAALRPAIPSGACESCGYPLAGLQRCPECGTESVSPAGTDSTGPAIPLKRSPHAPAPLDAVSPKNDDAR